MTTSDTLFLIVPVAAMSLTFFLAYYFFRIRPYSKSIEKMRQEIAELKKSNALLISDLDRAKKNLAETGQLTMMANLSAGMLHQISQPVTAIYGLIRFVKKEMAPDHSMAESIKVVDQQAEYLKEILENLTKIYKHKEIVREDVDINDIVEKSIHLLSDELRIGRVQCHMRLSELPLVIVADPIHVQQVFMNIIINAIQAVKLYPMTRNRSLYIYSSIDHAANEAVICFKNNGPKITAEQLANLFEPFYSTKREGVGIGLALCRKLVEEYDGHIIAHTNEGMTEFEISFPLKLKE